MIFTRGSFSQDHPANGFTLIEMVMVVAIMGLLIGAASLTLRNISRSDLRSAARRTAAAMRFAFDRAAMTGTYLRLAMNIDTGEIWIEASEERVVLPTGQNSSDTDTGKEKAEVTKSNSTKTSRKSSLSLLGGGKIAEGEGAEGEGEAIGIDAQSLKEEWEADLAPVSRPTPQFQPVKALVAKKIKLSKGISVDAVVTPRMVEPIEKGMAYIYFFPQGHSEPAIVHFLGHGNEYYSVVLHPLTGKAEVYPCQYLIPEDFGVSDDKRKASKRNTCAERRGI